MEVWKLRKKEKLGKVLRCRTYDKGFMENKKGINREYRYLDDTFCNYNMITKKIVWILIEIYRSEKYINLKVLVKFFIKNKNKKSKNTKI